jgi:hypothetical protein
MRNRPSIVYAWVTGGITAALCAVTLFAAREMFDRDLTVRELTQVLQESIGFLVFAIPMFIILLIPALTTISLFRYATNDSFGVLSLMVTIAAPIAAVFLWSRAGDKFFPSDFTTAVSFYVFAGIGALILWIRCRGTNRVEHAGDGKPDPVSS